MIKIKLAEIKTMIIPDLKEFEKAKNKVIKAEVNKIRRSMDTGLLRNSLFYHCPNIMKRRKNMPQRKQLKMKKTPPEDVIETMNRIGREAARAGKELRKLVAEIHALNLILKRLYFIRLP